MVRMGYKIHLFKTLDGNIVRFTYCKMKRVGTRNAHCYEIITSAGNTYLGLCPTALVTPDGVTESSIEAMIFKEDNRTLGYKVTIALNEPQNIRAYNELRSELALILRPNIEGYLELRKLAEEHRKYARHLSNCKVRNIAPTKTEPPSYDCVAERYVRAHLYIEAQKYQLSDTPAKQEAGRCAMKLLFEGSYAEVAKGFLDNWAVADKY